VSHDTKTFDETMEHAIDLGALDVEEGQDDNVNVSSVKTPSNSIQVYVDPDAVSLKARLFKDNGYEIHEADTVWVPLPDVLQEPDEATAAKMRRIMKELDADEDVTEVYSTAILAS
jgi:transcriptional/translational regulatory protein YebC/TACO1